jgi:hypothetical protein
MGAKAARPVSTRRFATDTHQSTRRHRVLGLVTNLGPQTMELGDVALACTLGLPIRARSPMCTITDKHDHEWKVYPCTGTLRALHLVT